jgi:hypothetical protein
MVSPTTNSGIDDLAAHSAAYTQPAAEQPAAARPRRGWLLVIFIATYASAFGIAARLLLEAAGSEELPGIRPARAFLSPLHRGLDVAEDGSPAGPCDLCCAVRRVVLLLLLDRDFSYVTALYIPLSYQAAVVFGGRIRWLWVGALVLLTAVSLVATWGLLHGLGLALTIMAFAVVVPVLAVASQQIEAARAESRTMVDDLQETHQRLKKYAAEVEDLAVLEERNRLARELHDSVSQAMFGIQLATRSAQIMRTKDPEAVRAQIEQLQVLTQDALARMRGFISELRPKS